MVYDANINKNIFLLLIIYYFYKKKSTLQINLSDIKNNRLNGFRAHSAMSPQCRLKFPDKSTSDKAKHSSVLLLLLKISDETHIVFIKRSDSGGVHSRQISFPGGAVEKSDNSLQETAIRECREETGIKMPVQIIRKLSDLYVPPSNFLIHPFVAYIDQNIEDFKANPLEVDKIFTENVLNFLKDDFRDVYHYYHNGKACSAPCFLSNGYAIWGATAMILNEFLQLIPKNFINLQKT